MRMSVSSGRGNFAAPFALLHRVVQPFAPVAGLVLGVGDGIDDDVIVKFFKDDVEGAFHRAAAILSWPSMSCHCV